MSTVDAVGNLHDQAGQFTRKAQAESDPAVLATPADRFLGAFEPFGHQPVEAGRFEVNDRFYAEVSDADRFDRGEPGVSFYDKHYPQWGLDGQFVASYYISTLRAGYDGDRCAHGLNMHTGVPAWQIPAADYAGVIGELARRAPSFDGLTHTLNLEALEVLDTDEQDQLATDLAGHPIPGEQRTLAELIRALGVHGDGGLHGDERCQVRFGDGRTARVTDATIIALSSYPKFFSQTATG